MMDRIREQIAELRGSVDSHEYPYAAQDREIADTMERMLAVCEAAEETLSPNRSWGLKHLEQALAALNDKEVG